tara:strand:- start:359 stop:619 length:261 start_codon:yes stop_codon:yes gene_type:complete
MKQLLNIFLLLSTFVYFFFVLNYYLSNKNIKSKNLNRNNIELTLKEKTLHIPILENDTEKVIEFNNSLTDQISTESRSFWNLIKRK